jgi:hypothetical protein
MTLLQRRVWRHWPRRVAFDNADLVAAYWEAHRLARGERADRVRAESNVAADEVRERITADPQDGLTLLDDLLAADDADVAFLGAGPLEDLLVEHGPNVAQVVAERCATASLWRDAVSGVWLDEQEWAVVAPLHPVLPKRA